MKSTAIVLLFGALALAATSYVEALNMWGPFVLVCLYTALMTVWVKAGESGESAQRSIDISHRKAA